MITQEQWSVIHDALTHYAPRSLAFATYVSPKHRCLCTASVVAIYLGMDASVITPVRVREHLADTLRLTLQDVYALCTSNDLIPQETNNSRFDRMLHYARLMAGRGK